MVIAAAHPLVREGLRSLLAQQPEFRVIGTASHGEEALAVAAERVPDVMLLDSALPKKSAVDVIRELRRTLPRIKTIVSASGVEQSELLALLRAGARGLIENGVTTDLLFKCVRLVHQGHLWVNRETVTAVMEQLSRHPEVPFLERSDFGLTPREREIVRRVVAGETNKKIAQVLSIGQDTVKHHLTRVFTKTATSNRVELAMFALARHIA